MYPGSEQPRGMLVLRIDAPIYYANVEVRVREVAVRSCS